MSQLESRLNNFDLIRLVASMSVLFYHSSKHLDLDFGLVGDVGLAFYRDFPGVPVFFVVSGYLIAGSLNRSSSLKSYARKRALRIFPALWVVTLGSVALVGVFGFVSWEVIASSRFWLWLAGQLSFMQLYNPPFLREFGVGALNGSLWTIPVEIGFYVLLPLIFWIISVTGLSSRSRDGFLVLLTIGSFCVLRWIQVHPGNHEILLLKLLKFSTIPHLYMFLFGVLLQLNPQYVDRALRGKAAVWLAGYLFFSYAGLALGVRDAHMFVFVHKLLLANCVIASAYTVPKLGGLLRGNDISYGVYLVHMPIVNAVLQMGWSGDRGLVLIPLILSVALATLSWRWVERPALSLK